MQVAVMVTLRPSTRNSRRLSSRKTPMTSVRASRKYGLAADVSVLSKAGVGSSIETCLFDCTRQFRESSKYLIRSASSRSE
jgi:hypothetical protein